MAEEALAVISEVVAALDRIGIPHVIGGSFASSVHGIPRATNDVDLVADVRSEHVEPLVATLGHEFYVEPTAVTRAIDHGSSFNLIHYETAFKVDVFVQGSDAFRRGQLARRTAETVGGVALYVLSPEDTVLAKLQWYRDGGEVSDRQWRDLVEVLIVQSQGLDMDYLGSTAELMGLGELLGRALREART